MVAAGAQVAEKMHFPQNSQIEMHADHAVTSTKICVSFNLRKSAGRILGRPYADFWIGGSFAQKYFLALIETSVIETLFDHRRFSSQQDCRNNRSAQVGGK